MKIETVKQNDNPESHVIWVDDVKIGVSDGIRFGFGFGLGIFLWGVLLMMVFGAGLKIIIESVKLF